MDNTEVALHFQDLFENTNDLIHFAGTDDRIRITNNAWLRTLGYAADDVRGTSLYQFIHPDCRHDFIRHRQQVVSGASGIHTTTKFLARDGRPVIVEGHISGVFRDGTCVYTRGVFRNITHQKAAERQLEASRKRLRAFFESAPDAVIVIDKDDIVLEWNPKAEEIFGFSHTEVIGKRLVETIIPPQYRRAHREGMKRFLETGEGPVLNKTIEITALHKERPEFHVNLSISSVRVDDEWLFIAFLSDISERKKMESRLIRKEAELMQSRVLDEKKDEFLGIASHELKTPLTTVKAYLQLALLEASRTQPESRIVGFLEKANVNTEKLSYLINELLDVSKIRSGKLELSPERVDLNEFLQNLLESLQFITPTHRIRYTPAPTPCIAEIDPLRMEQVITNFISNAAKYSPGKDLICVSCSCAGGHAAISVRDFGIGIPEDQLPNLFNRFFRVQDIASGFSGLGIGLFIAKEIVSRHGGAIRVESRPDEGSTFFVTIPLSPDQDAI